MLCPAFYTFVFNCYSTSARLFVIGGIELRSEEGTTQGDPSAMATYALALVPLMNILHQIENAALEVAFADDITGAGSLEKLLTWWMQLLESGPKYGYFPKSSKSYLIVKEEHYERAQQMFAGTGINVTSAGKRHLGAVIGSQAYKQEFVNSIVDKWIRELRVLTEIAETQPQAAYSAYIHGFKHKFTYTMRTIPTICNEMKRVEAVVRNEFIPAVTGGHACSDEERKLLSLPVKFGGLGIHEVDKRSNQEYEASRKVTQQLVDNIKTQTNDAADDVAEQSRLKKEVKKERKDRMQRDLETIISTMSAKEKRQNEIVIGSTSNWLTSLPLEEFNFNLNKMEFWDAIRLRYNWPIPNLPNRCACGEKFNVNHAMSCKKGGFVTQRHNELRDVTGKFLKEVCADVEIEPPLIRLTGEQMRHKTAKKQDDARPDISARDFWIKGQKTFLDVRVFDPNAMTYQHLTMKQCYQKHENEKKRHYNERILNVDQGSFSPLVFSVTGGIATEAKVFYSRLAGMIAMKRKVEKSIVQSFLNTTLNFALIRSMLMMLRGSRSLRKIDLTDETIAEVTRRPN